MKSVRLVPHFCSAENKPDAELGSAEDLLSRQSEKMRQDDGLNLFVLPWAKE